MDDKPSCADCRDADLLRLPLRLLALLLASAVLFQAGYVLALFRTALHAPHTACSTTGNDR